MKKWISQSFFFLGVVGLTAYVLLSPVKSWLFTPPQVDFIDISWPWPLGYFGLLFLAVGWIIQEMPSKKRPSLNRILEAVFDFKFDTRPEGLVTTSMRPARQDHP